MLIKHAVDLLYLCPPMKCEVNRVLNSLKVLTEFGVNLLNHILAGPFSIVGKALHMISFGTLWRCIRVLKISRWSRGSLTPLYHSICGIRNFCGRGKELTEVVNGESVLFTKSSRSLDTRPLRAFIITSICSFITCISVTISGGALSMRDGRLRFCRSGLFGGLLSSGVSCSLRLELSSWFSSWTLCPASLWCSCSSRSWFCFVRRSTTAMRVWTCLYNAVDRGGSSPWKLLVVAIERVSTMQLLCPGSD